MLLEILRGSDELVATHPAEDKQIFRRNESLYEFYLSKCDTVYVDTLQMVTDLMEKNPQLKILWTIRDLRDCALSKIYRGQPGNDTPILSDDATFSGCLDDIKWMVEVYNHLTAFYPTRVQLVKMEDVILNFDETISRVCEFCEIPYQPEMKNFTSRYRVTHKAKRYKSLDNKQVSLFKRKYEIYNGFYKNHNMDLDLLFKELYPFLKLFGYEK